MTAAGSSDPVYTGLEELLDRHGKPGTPADHEVLEELSEWARSVKGRRQIPFEDVPDGARMLYLRTSCTMH